jgi:hypothetical protein
MKIATFLLTAIGEFCLGYYWLMASFSGFFITPSYQENFPNGYGIIVTGILFGHFPAALQFLTLVMQHYIFSVAFQYKVPMTKAEQFLSFFS